MGAGEHAVQQLLDGQGGERLDPDEVATQGDPDVRGGPQLEAQLWVTSEGGEHLVEGGRHHGVREESGRDPYAATGRHWQTSECTGNSFGSKNDYRCACRFRLAACREGIRTPHHEKRTTKMTHRLLAGLLVLLLTAFVAGCADDDAESDSEAGATESVGERPLFVNVTSDDPHRARMALSFGKNQQALGHPVTVFLNDMAVNVGSIDNVEEYGAHQELISDIIAEGGTVIACPMCTEHYGVNADSYVDGIQMGNPELTGGKLFEEGSVALTW